MDFYTLFPKAENVHLFKEIGLTPYYMYKECGYSATVVSYKNGEYPSLDMLKGLNQDFLERKYSLNLLNIISYLRKNAKNMDVLLCFHYTSCIYFLFYKLFNPEGITYLKMDAGGDMVAKYSGNAKGLVNWIISMMVLIAFKTVIDFASVESRHSYDLFMDSKDIYKEKVIYVPIYIVPFNISVKKKNQIISVGRIGSTQKATEIVLQSFKKAYFRGGQISKNWVLKLIGPISEDFNSYIDDFFNENPELKDCIIFTGNIQDKYELYTYFQESKIFLLPSRGESSGIVFVEGAYYENYLIITPVGLAKQLMSLTKFGKLVEIDNVDNISDAIVDAINNYDKYKQENDINIKNVIGNEHSPEKYSHIIDDKIKSILNKNQMYL